MEFQYSPYYTQVPGSNNYSTANGMPFPLALAGAGLTAGAGLLGQYFGQKHDEKLASQQQAWNMAMAKQQNQWSLDFWNKQKQHNLEMWNLSNKYNSPLEQMARFKEAGLNPHLIYGKGTAGNASSVPSANLASASDVKGYSRAQSRNILEGFKAFQDYYNFKQLGAQTDNLVAQHDLIKQQAKGQAVSNLRSAIGLDIDQRTKNDVIRKLGFDADMAEWNSKKSYEDYLSLEGMSEKRKQLLENQVEELAGRVDNLKKQGKVLDAQKEIYDFAAQIKNYSSEVLGYIVELFGNFGMWDFAQKLQEAIKNSRNK